LYYFRFPLRCIALPQWPSTSKVVQLCRNRPTLLERQGGCSPDAARTAVLSASIGWIGHGKKFRCAPAPLLPAPLLEAKGPPEVIDDELESWPAKLGTQPALAHVQMPLFRLFHFPPLMTGKAAAPASRPASIGCTMARPINTDVGRRERAPRGFPLRPYDNRRSAKKKKTIA